MAFLDTLPALPRCSGLAAAPDGRHLAVTVARVDAAGTGWSRSVWQLSLDGAAPRRLTASRAGESTARYTRRGDLGVHLHAAGSPGRVDRVVATAGDGAPLGGWLVTPAEPEEHRGEKPANIEQWYAAVIGFLTHHLEGRAWTPRPLLGVRGAASPTGASS